MAVITVEVGVDEFSNSDLIEELESRGFNVHKGPFEEHDEGRARTHKLLAAMHDRFWDDNADLSTLLQRFVEILDGKRDDGEKNAE